jgi:hypothetical protein
MRRESVDMLWCWMDMQLDEVRGLGELSKYESHRPNTESPPSLGSKSDLLQDDLAGSPIASPQFQKSLHRRGGVILVVVVGVGEDGPALSEKAIHEVRPPQ